MKKTLELKSQLAYSIVSETMTFDSFRSPHTSNEHKKVKKFDLNLAQSSLVFFLEKIGGNALVVGMSSVVLFFPIKLLEISFPERRGDDMKIGKHVNWKPTTALVEESINTRYLPPPDSPSLNSINIDGPDPPVPVMPATPQGLRIID